MEDLKSSLFKSEEKAQKQKEEHDTIIHNTGEAPTPLTGKTEQLEWKEKAFQLERILKEVSK